MSEFVQIGRVQFYVFQLVHVFPYSALVGSVDELMYITCYQRKIGENIQSFTGVRNLVMRLHISQP